MKTRKKAVKGPGNGKRYPTTASGPAIEFERFLNGIKGGFPGGPGAVFLTVEEAGNEL
jgi:hypothetical protein